MKARETTVIVGAGHAGGRAALLLREKGYDGRIVLFGDEPEIPYERPALSKEVLLDGAAPEHMWLAPRERWQELDVELRLGEPVVALDRAARRLRTAAGSGEAYDRLVIATGGRPRCPEVPGVRAEAVHVVRTLADARRLDRSLATAGPVVVIGGGAIGIEVAAAARARGREVTVLEAAPQVLGRAGLAEAAAWLQDVHEANGVRFHLNARVERIEEEPGGIVVHAADADGGRLTLAAATVVLAVGIDPAVPFLAGSGIDSAGGIPTDSACRVDGDASIYAIGDVACAHNVLLGRRQRLETWRNAESQAAVVADAIVGRPAEYAELPWFWTDQYGYNLQILGRFDERDQLVERGGPDDGAFGWIALREKRVVGAALVNRGADRRPLEQLIRSRVETDPAVLADPGVRLRDLVARAA